MKKKLRKERPRVKLVLRCKIVMSPGFSNPKWSNWCTFYPFLTPNMTVKGQKWPQPQKFDLWLKIRRFKVLYRLKWTNLPFPKCEAFEKMWCFWKKKRTFWDFYWIVAIWWAVSYIYSLSSWPVTRTNNQSAFDLVNFISDLTTLEKSNPFLTNQKSFEMIRNLLYSKKV